MVAPKAVTTTSDTTPVEISTVAHLKGFMSSLTFTLAGSFALISKSFDPAVGLTKSQFPQRDSTPRKVHGTEKVSETFQ